MADEQTADPTKQEISDALKVLEECSALDIARVIRELDPEFPLKTLKNKVIKAAQIKRHAEALAGG